MLKLSKRELSNGLTVMIIGNKAFFGKKIICDFYKKLTNRNEFLIFEFRNYDTTFFVSSRNG